MADRFAPRFGAPITDWYRWFAWHPVDTVDRGWRWMRIVRRRRIHKYHHLDGGADFWFQHAVIPAPVPESTHTKGQNDE